MTIFKLKIIGCKDPMMWYRDKVGEFVPFVRKDTDCYISREPAGYSNVVKFEDAELHFFEEESANS